MFNRTWTRLNHARIAPIFALVRIQSIGYRRVS
jgi:hypothetical protein